MFPPIALPPFKSKKQAVSTGYYLKYPDILGSAKGKYAGWLEVEWIDMGNDGAKSAAMKGLSILRRQDKHSIKFIEAQMYGIQVPMMKVDLVGGKATVSIKGEEVTVDLYEPEGNTEMILFSAKKWSMSSKL